MRRLIYIFIIGLLLCSYTWADGSRYASNSLLSEGKWVKIRVDKTGIYKLSYADLKNMGFSDPSKVSVHGYGGWPLDEDFSKEYIDDVPSTPVWRGSDYLLFYGKGPVKWEYDSSSQTFVHTNNPYSLYGYYFVTDATPTNDMTSVAQASGASTRITTYDDYLLHEQELVSVNQSGREFFGEDFSGARPRTISTFSSIPGITDADGKEVSGSPFTTDKDGKILTGNLTPGEYTVEEVLPADSLYSGEAPKTVTVTAGKTAEVSFLNKLRTGKITIRKVDTKDEPLAGATFLLEGSEDGSLWYPVIPGSNGVCVLGERSEENLTTASKTSGEDGMLIWENLSITLQYRITETKAPEGYTLLKEAAFEGTLPADTLELQVVNGEAFALPKTGSTGLTVLPLAIIPCFSICAGAILYLRKREI